MTTETKKARIAALALLALLLAIELDVARSLSCTYDERAHIGAGLSYVVHGELVLNPEHPPLVKLLSGAVLRAAGVREGKSAAELFEAARRDPKGGLALQWDHGDRVILRENKDYSIPGALPGADSVVQTARAPLLVFPLLLAAVAWAWARARFGERGGLIALALVATWPDLLGHGVLVTTDVPVAALGLASGFLLDRLIARGGTWRLGLLGLALGAALATKFSAPLLVLSLLVAAGVALLRPVDPEPAALPHPFGRGSRRFTVEAALVVGVIAYLVVLAAYLGHEPLSALGRGAATVGHNHSKGYQALCLGEFGRSFWYYFPAALALKLPVGTLALLGLTAFAAASEPRARLDAPAEACLGAPAVVLFGTTMLLASALGTRYTIPALAFVLVSAGRLAPWAGASRVRWAAIVLALAANAAGVARDHPFHTSATNVLAGPPRLFYEWFDESNQDWNQGLKALARWQRERNVDDLEVIGRVFSEDLGRGWLEAYGVRATGRALDGGPLFNPAPGRVYAISAHAVARTRRVAFELARNARLAGEPVPLLALGGEIEPSELVGGGFLIFDRR